MLEIIKNSWLQEQWEDQNQDGWITLMDTRKRYKNVVQNCLDREIGGNICGKPHSFDCAWVIAMMTKGIGRKWKNMKIPTYFPTID
jgi:hypothetical protein